MLVTSDPSAQLVKIAQAEPVGAIDDDRVRVRNIETAFDDRRGQQHIGLAVDEFRHHFFQIIAVHLAVTDDHAGMRHQRLEFLRHGVDGHHPVVQEKHLPAAVQLALNGVADDSFIVLRDDRFHRQPVLRRRLNRAHVARAGQCQVKRTRNRSRAEGQHVHQLPEQLELLLLHHAEALFFVDDDQSQVLEPNIVLHQPVRADDDVHRAGTQVLDDPLLLASGAETAEEFWARAGRPAGHPSLL